MYQGGFIWDYMDQALWQINALGSRSLGYGGDFEERQSDYNFSGNGIVTADGQEKPCMQEVRYWYLPKRERDRWDEANRQAMLAVKPLPVPGYAEDLVITNGDGAWGVRGEKFEILFSKLHGGPVSLVSGGREWLWRAPRPALWRAPTENDLGCGFPERSAIWSAVDLWQKCTGWETQRGPDFFAITYRFGADVLPEYASEITYRVERQGVLTIEARYHGFDAAPELPLFGLRFQTPRPISETAWVGFSGETYPDRYKGGSFGRHTEKPHVPDYLVPQECGGHSFTHLAELRMDGGTLALEKAEDPFFFSAVPYTPAQLQEAQHVWELPGHCRTVVTLASCMRGVGGIDSWGTDVEKAYRVSGKENHVLRFRTML